MEEWRPVPGFEGTYEVSSLARVRRIVPGAGRAKVGAILSPGRNPKGYLSVGPMRDGKRKTFFLHTMVCEAWHGPKPSPTHQAAHRDDNKDNNTPDNLYWATPLENHADRRRNGGILNGSRIGRSKLKESDILLIRAFRDAGMVHSKIAKAFGVAPHTISRVLSGQRWGHMQ